MTQNHNDWLDDVLGASEVIPDAGFTERVMTAMPRPAPSSALTTAIIMGTTVVATLLTVALMGTSMTQLFIDLGRFDFTTGNVSLTAFLVLTTLAGLHFGLLAAED